MNEPRMAAGIVFLGLAAANGAMGITSYVELNQQHLSPGTGMEMPFYALLGVGNLAIGVPLLASGAPAPKQSHWIILPWPTPAKRSSPRAVRSSVRQRLGGPRRATAAIRVSTFTYRYHARYRRWLDPDHCDLSGRRRNDRRRTLRSGSSHLARRTG
jgi:hypothetical protein